MARLTLEASDPCQIAPCPRGYLAPCSARERAINCSSLLSEACFIARSCFDATPGAAAVSRQRCVLALHWSAANRRLYIPRNASERNCARRGLSVSKLPSSLMHLELIRPFNWTRQYFDDFRAPTVHPFGSTLCRAHTVGAAPVQRSASAAAQRSRCSPHAIDTSVWLLVGVHSTAEGRQKRDAIRRSWARSSISEVIVCFLIGAEGMTRDKHAMVQAESVEEGDLVLLPGIVDACLLAIDKIHAWWRAAATLVRASHGITHVAKTDDDVFLHLDNLKLDLRRLQCVRALYYGGMAHAGYNVRTFIKCGFSWSLGRNLRRSRFYRYGCPVAGAHPPFPFALGPLQVLSSPLVLYVADSAAIDVFVRRATATIDLNTWGRGEDVALGFWLSRSGENITYVSVNARSKNLGCFKHGGDYRPPSPNQIVLHYVKKPDGQDYARRVMHDGEPHDAFACAVLAGVS